MAYSPNAAAERDLADGVVAALAALPGTHLHETAQHDSHSQPGRRIDLLAVVDVNGRPARIVVEVKSSGYPRDVRAAAAQLKEALSGLGSGAAEATVLLVAAPALSPGSRELLRRQGIGYWDRSGSLYLQLPWALYYVDRPPPKGDKRRLQSVYRGRTAQVLHALLLGPDRWWGVRELAAHAEASPYTVHRVFTFLEDQLWVEKRGTGPGPGVVRRLVEPGQLLDAWAEAHSLGEYKPHRFHAWAQSPAALRRAVTAALERAQAEYALTLAPGADLVAPFSTESGQVALLVPASSDAEELAARAGLRPVDEGETVTFFVTRDRSPLLFRRRVHDCWVASDVQLYLDLWAWPRRGKEQARHLRAERLPY